MGPIYRDEIWLYVNLFGSSNKIEKLYLNSGGREWVWDDLTHINVEDVFFHQGSNTLILHRSERLITVDGYTGLTTNIFIQREGDAISEGHLLGDHYYHVRYDNFYEGEKFVVRSKVTDLTQWDTIYSIDPAGHESDWIFVEGFQDWVNPVTGDQHLLFIHQGVLPYIDDVINYNISQDSVEWVAEMVAEGRDAGSTITYLFEDKILLISGFSITCVDLFTSEVLWQARLEEDNYFNHFIPPVYLSSDNSLIVQSSQTLVGRKLLKLNANSGDILAASELYEFTDNSHFTHFGDYIISFEKEYSIVNRMLLLDAGNLSLKKSIGGEDYSLEGPLYVYPEDSILLSVGHDSLYAFDLNKIIAE